MSTTLIPAPAQVNGLPVLASKALSDRTGHSPGHAVLCCRDEDVDDPWVTWIAYSHDHGRTWLATAGHYFTDEGAARGDLHTRDL